jgi:hypothetical protein
MAPCTVTAGNVLDVESGMRIWGTVTYPERRGPIIRPPAAPRP